MPLLPIRATTELDRLSYFGIIDKHYKSLILQAALAYSESNPVILDDVLSDLIEALMQGRTQAVDRFIDLYLK